MSEFVDPFAGAPEDEAQAAPTPEPEEVFQAPPAEPPAPAKKAPAAAKKVAPKAATEATPSEGKVVLTFKGGRDFDAPWIVIHAQDLDDALDQVSGDNAGKLATIMERSQAAGKHFASLAPKGAGSTAGSGGGGQRQPAPAGAQQAPNGEKRFCSHGEMRFKSDVSKAGKPYKGFFCTETDRNSQCQAQFLR